MDSYDNPFNKHYVDAYVAALGDGPPRLTVDQERAVWQQVFVEQKARADSLFRAWVTMTIVAMLTNVSWIAWTFWR